MTTIEFASPFMVLRSDKFLRLAPIIETFKDKKKIKIYYVIGGRFDYQGLSEYTDKYVDIGLRRMANTFDFSVTVKNHAFSNLQLPEIVNQPGQSANAQNFRKRIGIIVIVLAGLIAVCAGVLGYILLDNKSKKRNNS